MKNELRLVVYSSAAYAIFVYLLRGFISDSIQSTLIFLVAPLVVLASVLSWDLLNRAKIASPSQPSLERQLPSLSHEVQQLTKRIQVGTKSSQDFYNKVLIYRLRDMLVEKASVETGLPVEDVRKILRNPRSGKRFLRDENFYNLLYIQRPPKPGPRRQEMLNTLIGLIEAWKA